MDQPLDHPVEVRELATVANFYLDFFQRMKIMTSDLPRINLLTLHDKIHHLVSEAVIRTLLKAIGSLFHSHEVK